jgi:hypothetical protein
MAMDVLASANIKSMTRTQLLQSLRWRLKFPHFPGAAEEIAAMEHELVLRFTDSPSHDGVD